MHDPANPTAVTGPPQRGGIGRIGLHNRHQVAQVREQSRLAGRPPGESQARLPNERQGADSMRAGETQRSGHYDYARIPSRPAASQGSGVLTL